MKKSYIVGAREVHVRFYTVTAENEEKANELVNDCAPGVTDTDYQEYSHQMPPDTWSVEEQTQGLRPSA